MAKRPARRTRRRAVVRLALFLVLVVAAEWRNGVTYWEHHRAQVVLAGLALVTLVGGILRLRWLWLHRTGVPTVLYRNYLDATLIASIDPRIRVRPGQPIYYGISNGYARRCEQHAVGDYRTGPSWWWPLIDPSLSTTQTYENRRLAERAEAAAIRRDCPVGNDKHNWQFHRQTTYRNRLKTVAAQVAIDRPTGKRTLTAPPGAFVRPARWRGRQLIDINRRVS